MEKDEFFDLEDRLHRGDFLAKVQICQLYFNLLPPTYTNYASGKLWVDP